MRPVVPLAIALLGLTLLGPALADEVAIPGQDGPGWILVEFQAPNYEVHLSADTCHAGDRFFAFSVYRGTRLHYEAHHLAAANPAGSYAHVEADGGTLVHAGAPAATGDCVVGFFPINLEYTPPPPSWTILAWFAGDVGAWRLALPGATVTSVRAGDDVFLLTDPDFDADVRVDATLSDPVLGRHLTTRNALVQGEVSLASAGTLIGYFEDPVAAGSANTFAALEMETAGNVRPCDCAFLQLSGPAAIAPGAHVFRATAVGDGGSGATLVVAGVDLPPP